MSIGSSKQGATIGYRLGWRGRSIRRIAFHMLAVLSLALLPLFSIAIPAQGRGPASATRLPGVSATDNADEPTADSTEPGESPTEQTTAPKPKPNRNTLDGTRSTGSVRPRGAEAPRTVETPVALSAPTPVANRERRAKPEQDRRQVTGQSAPLNSSAGATFDASRPGSSDKDTSTRQSNSDPDIRLWPIKAGRFTFTQGFGCVHQIGNFYQSSPGCPAGSPVVHTGVDLAAPEGTPFYAAASGWVTEAGLDRATGLANTRIVIQHDGKNDRYATEYLHWISSFVKVGDYVEAGQPIAEVGSVGYSTGPHLHFGVIDLNTGSSLDPLAWLPENRSVGNYQTIEPDARRQTFKTRSSGTPDYEDPSPPPTPKRVSVPESPKASRDDAQNTKQAGGAASDETSQRHDRRKERRTDERKAERQSTNETAANAETGGRSADNTDAANKRAAKRDRNTDTASGSKRDEQSPEVTPTPTPDPAEDNPDAGNDKPRKNRKNNGGGNDRESRHGRNDSSAKNDKADGGKNGNNDQNSKDDPQKDQADNNKNPDKNKHQEGGNQSPTNPEESDGGGDPVTELTPTPEPSTSDEPTTDDTDSEQVAEQAAQIDPAPSPDEALDEPSATGPEGTIEKTAKPKNQGKKQR